MAISWQGTTLMESNYFGNTGTVGDTTTPVGNLYIDWERAAGDTFYAATELDVRPSKVVHVRDGISWSEEFDYESSSIPANTNATCSPCATFRSTANVVAKRLKDSNGNIVSRMQTSFFHSDHPAYDTANLLRLPESESLKWQGQTLKRTDYSYDDTAFPPVPSGAPNLDASISVRGNPTTVTSYLVPDPVNPVGPVSIHTRYYDTGDIQQQIDGNGNATTMALDFTPCSSSALTLTNTATNAKGHKTTTLTDCSTGSPLRVTDPNNQSTYTQYDQFGRAIETAGPGDKLSGIANGTRDPGALLNGGNTVGNSGNGPTTWIDYLSLGVPGQQHTVTHIKDGTSDGHYVKTFTDGLGRTIQTRTEVDPNKSSGNPEVVVRTIYNNMGKVGAVYVPCFDGASDQVTIPSCTQATTTTYDALGRTTSVQLPGIPNPTTARQQQR